jgi:hypothetical protein
MNYCLNCGVKAIYVEDQQPKPQEQDQYQQQYQQTYYQQPYYQQPHYTEPRRPSNLGRKIPSIILAAFGLLFGVIDIIYTLLGFAIEPEVAIAFAIAFSIFSFPLSIVGRSLSRKCVEDGDYSASASVGSKLGTAGMVLTIISWVLGFIAILGI